MTLMKFYLKKKDSRMLQLVLNLISWKIVEVIKLVRYSSILQFLKWLLGHFMPIQQFFGTHSAQPPQIS